MKIHMTMIGLASRNTIAYKAIPILKISSFILFSYLFSANASLPI